jgi:hypothetical protein
MEAKNKGAKGEKAQAEATKEHAMAKQKSALFCARTIVKNVGVQKMGAAGLKRWARAAGACVPLAVPVADHDHDTVTHHLAPAQREVMQHVHPLSSTTVAAQ